MAEISPGSGRANVTRGLPSGTANHAKTVRRIEIADSGIVNAAGVCQIQLAQVPVGSEYYIERLSVRSTSVLASIFRLYRDLVDDLYQKEATATGNDNIADEATPIWFASGNLIIARWTNATPTAICSINAQVRVES